jgi:glycosyltransferase involved in cell wall biosynthesis
MKWEAGEREAALNFLERGFILSPTGTDNLQLYHSAVSETGAFERAEKFLLEAESLHPAHKKIQYLLVDVFLRQEKNEAAMERIESSIAHFGMDDGMMKAALEVRKKVGPREIPEKGEKGTVSLCLIVKDEEKYLARCLQSAKTIVDEMIVVDTGSSDRTKELATIFGAKVFDFAWENDFSLARNDSLSKASGDWILVLDADEMISEKDHHFLCNLRQKKNGHPRAFSFVTRNYVNRMDLIGFTPNDGSYPEEEGAGWTPSEKVRLFPNDRRSCFENPVHEMIRPALEKNQVPIQKCPVPVHHYGKLDSEREKEKGERYYALGRKKLELHSDLSSLTELAIQAGALGHFDEAISLWNQVLVLDPKMTDAYINLSYNHLKLKKYTEAAQLAQRARELDPDSKEGLLNYSSAEFYCGNIERVVASLEDFLPRCLEYPPILGLLSLAYFLEGKIEKGLPLVEKLKRIGFDYKEYVLNSAQDLIAAGQEKKAAKLIEIIKKSHKQPLRNAEMGIG